MKLKPFIIGAIFCGLLPLSACSGSSTSILTGWYLEAENGSVLMVTADNEPLSLSDRSRDGTLFEGLDDGDFIEITHDAIAETYPGQAGVYTCKKLLDGSFEDVPADAVADLTEMGYTFASHSHSPAAEPLTVDAPVSGYCGNTTTEILLNDQSYSFWGEDSVTLTDIFINLSYDPGQICRCLPEFTVNTEFGSGYGISLSNAYVRCEAGQAALTVAQVEQIRGILERNCT